MALKMQHYFEFYNFKLSFKHIEAVAEDVTYILVLLV